MVYRIFGRKKSGKTEYIYAAMQKHIENGKKCFLIVPEQQTLQTERELLKRFGNSVNLNVETVSFTRLCNRVFRETGGLSQKYIDDAGRLLVMAETLLKLQPSLREYKDCAENAEFSKTVINILDEFKKYNIENQKIEDTLKLLERNNDEKILYNKLSDIFLIGSSYKNLLRKNFNDRGDDLDRLSLVLKDYDFFAGTEVFIDSFYGFTPQELKIILNILRQAENTYVTFLCEQNSKDAIFGRGISASSEISGLCRKHGLEFCDETVNYISAKPQLQYLEENFRTENCIIARNIQASGNNGDIRIISCKNAFSEANAAACIISRLVRDGAKYKDIAVCARNIASYEGIIDAVLQRDKIPFTFNSREDLQTKSVCAFIISAFEFIFAFRSDFLIKHIKTGLTKLTDEECDILECYIRTWNISGKKTIFSDWCMNPDGYTETFDEKAEKLLNKINIAKEKVLPQFEAFCEDVKDSRTVKDIARAVYRFIEWSESENSNFSEEDAEYRNFVVRALNQMALVLGNESISAPQFLEYFKLVISNYTVAQIPECVDSVYIGSAELMRTGNIKYMIILGCNSGVFPNTDFEEGIFSDREKKKLGGLGIEISACLQEKIYDEFFIAYNAMCEPAEKLFVLYS